MGRGMGNHYDGRAFLVDLPQKAHDFISMGGIEVAGRFVSQ